MSNLKIVRLVKIKKLHPEAVVPNPKNGDVGYDLSSVQDVLCKSGKVTKISTGLALARALKSDDFNTLYFKVEGRSGLASNGLFPVGGIIDPSYRGELVVMLYNSSDSDYEIKKGDRVAQLVCYHVLSPNDDIGVKFEETEVLEESDRSDNGFGSSGR